MRMKEVCGKTGLTDRAVRLYMDSGLISPDADSSYTGRKSIRFSDADVEILEAVATLRKADFSIADIRTMQSTPEQVKEILETHKQKLVGDIENKQMILQHLREIDGRTSPTYMDIAEHLRRSASRNHIPKEDSGMHLRDIQEIFKKRKPALIAFALLLVNVALYTSVVVRSMFGECKILGGYGIYWVYEFGMENILPYLPVAVAWLCMAVSVILLFSYIINGRKKLLPVVGVLCVLASILMFFPLGEAGFKVFECEFILYRFSFLWNIIGGTSREMDLFIRSLKFIPVVTAAAVAFVLYFRRKNTEEDITAF